MRNNYLLRNALLPIAVVLLIACSPSLWAQQTLKSYLNGNVHTLKVGGNSTVNIQPGDTNMVFLTTSEKQKNVFLFKNGELEMKDGNHSLTLVVKEPSTFTVDADGNATVNVADFDCSRFYVTANNNSIVNLQTLRSKHCELLVLNNGAIHASTLLLTDGRDNNSTEAKISAYQNGIIHVDSLLVGDVYMYAYSNAIITVERGKANYREERYDIEANATINGRIISKKSLSANETDIPTLLNVVNDIRSVKERNLFHGDMFYGFSTCVTASSGTADVNHAADMQPAFGALKAQIKWRLLNERDYDLSIGIGIALEIYKFSNYYVNLAENNGQGHFEVWDVSMIENNGFRFPNPKEWQSTLSTCYITMPITYSRYFGNKCKATIGIVSGINVSNKEMGLLHSYYDKTLSYADCTSMSNYLNPFKCDVVAMLQFSGIGLYVQAPTMSFTRHMDTQLYPFQFGIVLL